MAKDSTKGAAALRSRIAILVYTLLYTNIDMEFTICRSCSLEAMSFTESPLCRDGEMMRHSWVSHDIPVIPVFYFYLFPWIHWLIIMICHLICHLASRKPLGQWCEKTRFSAPKWNHMEPYGANVAIHKGEGHILPELDDGNIFLGNS